MTRRAPTALTLLLLAILGFLIWQREPGIPPADQDPALPRSTEDKVHSNSGSSQLPSKLPRPDTGPTPSHATHSPEELRDFIIPSLTTKNATVEEALTALLAQYNEICHNTGETPLNFSYHITGTPESPVTLNLTQTSFLRVLLIIAARSGLVLERDSTSLVFTPMRHGPAKDLLTRRQLVPPDFLQQTDGFLHDTPLQSDDPFAPAHDGNTAYEPRQSVAETLMALGVVRSSNAGAAYLPGSSTLVVKAPPADLARLDAFLQNEASSAESVGDLS